MSAKAEWTQWTPELAAAAAAEGWDLFDSHGSLSGPWQVQSFDSPEEGEPDITEDDAWALVQAQATPHARVALEILAEANPLEHARIVAHPTVIDGHWDYDNDCAVFTAGDETS